MCHIYQLQGVKVGPEVSLTGPRGSVVSSTQCPFVWELGCVSVAPQHLGVAPSR